MPAGREVTPQEARSALRKIQIASRRNQRLHGNQQEKNVQQMRALEGLCGNCTNLKPLLSQASPNASVELRCSANLSPVNLYRNTPLGQEAICEKFEQNPETLQES